MKTKIFSILMVLVMTVMAIPSFVSAAVGPLTLVAVPSSTTIIRSTLVPSSGGVPTGGNSAVDTAVAGLTPIAVTLNNAGSTSSDLAFINPIGAGGDIQLWAKDTGGYWSDINVTGWGPSTGFPVPPGSVTTNVYAISDIVHTYTLTVNLVYVSAPTIVIATTSGVIDVMDATTLSADVVLPTILFSVDKTDIDFGTVIAGRPSEIRTYRITNLGNLPITVQAVVSGDLYVNFMQLDDTKGWRTAQGAISPIIATLPAWNSVDVQIRLVNPTAAYAGTNIPGTLTFIASSSE
jgi:hypothetical protein